MSKLDDRFVGIYNQIFPLSKDTGIRNFNPDGLTQQNISLLLIWPGIMACEFGATVNEKKMLDDLSKLRQLKLKSEWENRAVNDLTLHRDFTKAEQEMNEEISIVIKNIAAKNNFLQMLSGIHFDDTDKFEELIRLFCDFTVVCFAIIKNLRTKESKIEYSYETIEKEFVPYVKDNLLYFHLNCLSMQWLAMVDDPFQHFSDDDFDFENLLKSNDTDDYLDELFGKQENRLPP